LKPVMIQFLIQDFKVDLIVTESCHMKGVC